MFNETWVWVQAEAYAQRLGGALGYDRLPWYMRYIREAVAHAMIAYNGGKSFLT